MSNFLAIATVTATLGQVLRNVVRNDVNGAEVTSVDPANSNGLPPTRVNVYLYQVAQCSSSERGSAHSSG